MADSLTKVLVVRLEAFSYKFCFFVLVVFSHCSLPARTGSRPAENYAGKPFYLYFTTIANPPVSPSPISFSSAVWPFKIRRRRPKPPPSRVVRC